MTSESAPWQSFGVHKCFLAQQYWHKNRLVDQWNRIKKKPEIDQHIYGQLIFDKEAKTIQWKNETIFMKAPSTNGSILNGCLHGEECKQTHIYHPTQNSIPTGSTTIT